VDRDFFAFCTSLKRPELRAIGELSWVRHVAEGEILYRPGEPGNALFIVNRGVLQVGSPKEDEKGSVLLKRGEVIGHVEVFSQLPRMYLVKALEATSVQCFPQGTFPELVKHVPSFFRYLCEQMALRVIQVSDVSKNHEQGAPLSGRISHFDLTTVHQTIASSGQTGELSIRDEQAEPVAAFYFEAGRPSAGQFQHLTGEEAFWQLFLSETLSGTFSFSVGERPLTNWIDSGRITRTSGDMLIAALQFRDEFNALKKEIPEDSAKLTPTKADLQWNGENRDELRPVANRIWELVSRRPASVKDLYRQCSVCELKIYQVVNELLTGKQVAFG
jgi:CRP-like cAMP-binding protein